MVDGYGSHAAVDGIAGFGHLVGVPKGLSGCVGRVTHDVSKASYKKERQDGKCQKRGGERPGIGQGIAVKGTVDVEQVVVAQGEQHCQSLYPGGHGHDGERHAADAEGDDTPKRGE